MKTYSKSLSQFILLVLEKAIDGYVRFEDFTYHHYRYQYGYPELKKSSLAAALRRLREGGLIEVDRKDVSGIIVKLTEVGRDALGKLMVDDKKWDGIWRVVIFDIPEKHSTVRNLLRRRLKEWGFKRWQQSVWITKNDITHKLRKLIDNLNIKEWVAVIESNDPALNNIL